jgi:hypothetical protein
LRKDHLRAWVSKNSNAKLKNEIQHRIVRP